MTHVLEFYRDELSAQERAELDPLIHEWLLMRAGEHPEGKTTTVGMSAFFRALQQKRGYQLSRGALRWHVSTCEKGRGDYTV